MVWTAVVTGFHLVLRKSNLVPVKRMHDTVHNIVCSDVKYFEGIMIINIRWLKTDQLGQDNDPKPSIANPNSTICLVGWLIFMMNSVPALPSHNLFSFNGKNGLVPVTY